MPENWGTASIILAPHLLQENETERHRTFFSEGLLSRYLSKCTGPPRVLVRARESDSVAPALLKWPVQSNYTEHETSLLEPPDKEQVEKQGESSSVGVCTQHPAHQPLLQIRTFGKFGLHFSKHESSVTNTFNKAIG